MGKSPDEDYQPPDRTTAISPDDLKQDGPGATVTCWACGTEHDLPPGDISVECNCRVTFTLDRFSSDGLDDVMS